VVPESSPASKSEPLIFLTVKLVSDLPIFSLSTLVITAELAQSDKTEVFWVVIVGRLKILVIVLSAR
jgi:hypothetical protein